MAAVCTVCHGSGFKVHTDSRGVASAVRCDCGKEDRSRRLLRSANIPKRYDHCTFETFEPHHETLAAARALAVDWVERWPLVENGLLLIGPPGTGKTHLAVAMARALITSKGVRALFYEQREMLKALQWTFDDAAARTKSEVLGPILDAEVLVLDDLGVGRTTAWAMEVMHDVMAHRYNGRLPLIMTSNHPLGDDDEGGQTRGKETDKLSLRDRLGAPLMSRLYEMCRIVPMQGKDYRRGVLHAEHRG